MAHITPCDPIPFLISDEVHLVARGQTLKRVSAQGDVLESVREPVLPGIDRVKLGDCHEVEFKLAGFDQAALASAMRISTESHAMRTLFSASFSANLCSNLVLMLKDVKAVLD